ncbi:MULTISPECIES: hypothetical protein [Paenibacillus]|uniref:hypothetical protein n=1 Tax=Paenibacillus TaxID=44249 RepID=UPI002FDF9209
MDYSLFINTSLDGGMLGELFYKLLSQVLKESPTFNKYQHRYGYRYINIGCEYFLLTITLDDDDMTDTLECSKEDFGIESSWVISVQFVSRNFGLGWLKFLEVIGKFLREVEGEMLLLDDGSSPIMKRAGGTLFVSDDLDAHQSSFITNENLKSLNYPYLYGSMR